MTNIEELYHTKEGYQREIFCPYCLSTELRILFMRKELNELAFHLLCYKCERTMFINIDKNLDVDKIRCLERIEKYKNKLVFERTN